MLPIRGVAKAWPNLSTRFDEGRNPWRVRMRRLRCLGRTQLCGTELRNRRVVLPPRPAGSRTRLVFVRARRALISRNCPSLRGADSLRTRPSVVVIVSALKLCFVTSTSVNFQNHVICLSGQRFGHPRRGTWRPPLRTRAPVKTRCCEFEFRNEQESCATRRARSESASPRNLGSGFQCPQSFNGVNIDEAGRSLAETSGYRARA